MTENSSAKWTTLLVGGLVAIGAAFAAFLPAVVSVFLFWLAKLSFFLGMALTSAGTWMARNSNNTYERLAWALLFLIGLAFLAWNFLDGILELPGALSLVLVGILLADLVFLLVKADDEPRP